MATTDRCSIAGCPMTMGYYIGGGQYICWLHALTVPGCMRAVQNQEPVALVRGENHVKVSNGG